VSTTQSGQAGGQPGQEPDVAASERRHLINIAYRLLGSLAEAEDAVQEAFARWYAMPDDRRAGIESPAAWLTTVTSRICLDLLGSARARRERYTGEWLPRAAAGTGGAGRLPGRPCPGRSGGPGHPG
jgi:DNA-directed RNA polymerase specialized sigma24 family protein